MANVPHLNIYMYAFFKMLLVTCIGEQRCCNVKCINTEKQNLLVKTFYGMSKQAIVCVRVLTLGEIVENRTGKPVLRRLIFQR